MMLFLPTSVPCCFLPQAIMELSFPGEKILRMSAVDTEYGTQCTQRSADTGLPSFLQCQQHRAPCFPRLMKLLLAFRCLGNRLCPLSFWKYKTNSLCIIIATVILLFKKRIIFILWWQIWKREICFLSQWESVAFQYGSSVKTQLSPWGSSQAFIPHLRAKHWIQPLCHHHFSRPAFCSCCSQFTCRMQRLSSVLFLTFTLNIFLKKKSTG